MEQGFQHITGKAYTVVQWDPKASMVMKFYVSYIT